MLRDRLFWLAMAVGPVFWALLALGGGETVAPGWIGERPGTFLTLALLYPVAEEIVFRGLLQEALASRLPPYRLGPLTAANLTTSALFSGLHALTHPPLWAAGVFVPSLLFGFMKERHASLAAPVTLHAFYNAGYFGLFGAA
jgi:hypothetical protein